MFPITSRTQTTQVFTRLFGWLEVGGAVSEEAGGTDGFGEGDFFLKTATANAGENAGFDPGAITARDDTIFFLLGSRGGRVGGSEFGLRFDPDGWRFADFADTGDTFARFEG